ncbi:putative polysaccharide export ABC transporter permease protein [Halobacteriovorax marinus SJ]|uniref:Transport permease protein n=1 Tax=Halobacteriovorax marinus (strain ATCC BAA-682 / DSM 15412 / SJ) TaxID=862908 RepID=E1WZW3_HALMS|nr:ABC transporter permease [Halobacteriovorax marinus]CBW27899.1 putative polysaccharide export ABC transporter permease protein [Halobacteriovorax marinus SJ]
MESKLSIKEYSRQVLALTSANMKARYRKTIAGFLWVILNPIIMYSVQSFVFKKILKLEVPDYSLFLLCGLLPWIFITMNIEMITPILEGSRELLKSFSLKPSVLVLSQVIDNFINFLVAFTVILLPFWFLSDLSLTGIFFIPIILLSLVIGVFSMCFILSVMQLFFRDIRFIVSFVTSVLFFLTPIFYPIEFIPTEYRIFVELNPIYSFIEPFRFAIYDFSMDILLQKILKSIFFSMLFSISAFMIWKRKRGEFYVKL